MAPTFGGGGLAGDMERDMAEIRQPGPGIADSFMVACLWRAREGLIPGGDGTPTSDGGQAAVS